MMILCNMTQKSYNWHVKIFIQPDENFIHISSALYKRVWSNIYTHSRNKCNVRFIHKVETLGEIADRGAYRVAHNAPTVQTANEKY